jgi:hypothetical protein
VSRESLIKIQAATAVAVCANFDLPRDAKKLLGDNMNPREFLAALMDEKNYVAAIDFIAHALPVSDGIWWGCLCMQHALGDRLSPPDRAAATAAVMWVMQPTEDNRAAAKAPVEAAGPLSPAGALAMAANQTGGSIYPPELSFKAPEPFAPQQAIARAVKLASIKTDPPNTPKVQRFYVQLGLEVAAGRLI